MYDKPKITKKINHHRKITERIHHNLNNHVMCKVHKYINIQNVFIFSLHT